MKIKLNEEVTVDIEPVDLCGKLMLGCHLIKCDYAVRLGSKKVAPCEVGDCTIENRGFAGDFYELEEVEDLIIKEEIN